MICDGFRIPMRFPLMSNNQIVNQLQIFKMDRNSIEKRDDPILSIIRDGDHYCYKNKNNDDCTITYNSHKISDNSYDYNCKVVDSTFGTYEECVSERSNSVLFESYENENPIFYYEMVDDDFECAISGKSAKIIKDEVKLIIVDYWKNYFILSRKARPLLNNIIEEGLIQDDKFVPTLKYSRIGDDLLIIDNYINHCHYMAYLN